MSDYRQEGTGKVVTDEKVKELAEKAGYSFEEYVKVTKLTLITSDAGEPDFQEGSAASANVLPKKEPALMSMVLDSENTSSDLPEADPTAFLKENIFEAASTDLPKVDPIEEVKLPTLESFIPEEAYSTDDLGRKLMENQEYVIDPEAKQDAKNKYDKHYAQLSKVNTDLTKVGLDSAIELYRGAYGNKDGFDFVKSGRGVTVSAPNGETETFKTTQGGFKNRLDGSFVRTQSWSDVQKFVEKNKDPEAAARAKRVTNRLESRISEIIERGDYYDLPGGDAYIKDSNDLYENHPKLVKEIKNEAISQYNRNYKSEGENGFFGDSAWDMANITEYKEDQIVASAFGKAGAREVEENDIFTKKIISDKAKNDFNGDPNALANWITKGGAKEIVDPNKKIIANKWGEAYKLEYELDNQQIGPEELAIKTKQLEAITAEATALSKEHLNPNNVILFNPTTNSVQTSSTQEEAEDGGVDITTEVNVERQRLLALKSGSFQALRNRYVAHRLNLIDMRSNLKTEYDVETSDGRKYSAPLKDLVDGYFGTGLPAGIKVSGKKESDEKGGGMQSVMDEKAIEGIAKDYLNLKARDIAFQDMYLLNIDPKSVERTGFFGAAGEGFLESLSSGDTVDYYSGQNSSDVLAEMENIGIEAGMTFDKEQRENFKETLPEFLGTTVGGLPVLAAEFAVANVVSGGVLGVTGLGTSMTGMRAAGGFVNKLKLESINSVVEAVKMQAVMGDGGFAMGATFSPAASLVNTLAGRLGIKFKAKGPFHKLNDLVLKPATSGIVMIPSAEGGALIEAGIEDFIGGKDFNTHLDENFRDLEWLGEGGIARRQLGHAIAGSLLAYSHLPVKKIFGKNLKGQYALRREAGKELERLNKTRKNTKSKAKLEELKIEIQKNEEVFTAADNYISEAFALDQTLDPQESGRQALKDFAEAGKNHKKQTGKDLNVNVRVELEGDGMDGKAAQVSKQGDGWNIVVDARKYHKGIFGHELGHVYGEVFNINDAEGLKEINKFIGKTVNENLGVDFKGLIEKLYKGKQVEELNPEEYLMGIIEVLGKGGQGLVRNNAYGQIAQNLKSFYERRMERGFKGDAPQLRIESPQELLSLLQRLAQGAGKKGSVKQFAALQGLYINGKYVFNGKTKAIKGSYGSLGVSGELSEQAKKIKKQIDDLENEFYDEGQMDIDVFDQQLANLNKKFDAANKAPVVEKAKKTKPKVVNNETKELKEEKGLIGDALNEMIPKDMSSSEWTKVAGPIVKKIQEGMLFPLFKKQIAKMGIVPKEGTVDVYGKTAKEFYNAAINPQFLKNILTFKPKTKERPGGNDDFGGYIIGSQFGLNNRIKEALTELRKGKELNEASDAGTAKDLAAENDFGPAVSEKRLIEPVDRLITDPVLKKKYIEKVNEATESLDPESTNFKTLVDAAPELTKELFGRVMKVKNGKTSVDAAKTKIEQQIFIRKNAESIYALLPLGARRQAEGLSTSTGIKPILLKKFYEAGSRADMMEGTAAGLPTQLKKAFDKTAFLEVFGANKGQKADRNQQTAIDALIAEVGKLMTNRTYRQKLEGEDYSMRTIQKIADGKSESMAAMDVNYALKIGQAILKSPENEASEQTYRQLVSQMSRNLPRHFVDAQKIINSAAKRNVSVEQIVEERLMQEVNWKKRYNEEGLEYTSLNDIGSGVNEKGEKRSENLSKGLKVILEAFPDMETAPSWIRNSLMSTVGVNESLRLDGKKINQKTAGVNNRPDMIESYYGKIKYNKNNAEKWDQEGSPYQYSYFKFPGKGASDPKKIGGTGFNGKIEKKLVALKEKYNNNTNDSKFRQEFSDYVRNELTHPSLKGTPNGYELTAEANLNVVKKAYTSLYDAVKSGKITETTAADVLRIQTNHSDGIFKVLIPYESVTMGNIGKYKKGNAKNTHNEHMVELMNYNLDFVSLLKKSKNRETAIEGINDLIDGLSQAIVDVPTQKVKDSKRFGGSAKQVYKSPVLNTFLRTGSLNNNLIIKGEYKGYTQAEALYDRLGPKGLESVLNKVPERKRKVQWNTMNDALQKLKEQKSKASLDLTNEFDKIIKETTGVSEDLSRFAAREAAGSKGKYNLLISASADDFVGLMNYNAGKGKRGDANQKWFKKNLYDPYSEAYRGMNSDNVKMGENLKAIRKNLKENKKEFKLKSKIKDSNFTFEQAVRVAVWDSEKLDIPGISEKDLSFLRETINESQPLSVLAQNLKRISGGKYAKPGTDWFGGGIETDLRESLNTTARFKRLEQWKENVDAIFTPEALNKLEAAHGTPYRKALINMLEAMYTGRSRKASPSSLEGRTLNYLNNSVGTIMFLNTRSAALQLQSSLNYVNFSDNNPLKAGAALANVPQFSKDFMTLIKSDWATSRRDGLKINVTESEIADAANGSANTSKSIVALIIKKGFLPTQFMDSFATALGGAPMYRNRIKTYMKEVDVEGNKVYTEEQAADKAMSDWIEISETSQQSSRPDKVSMQQRSDLGKLVLAFANTPMQYARESKKAVLDLKNKRGDAKTNISKLAYYAFAQSALFSAMQSAMFKMLWSDEEENAAWIQNKAPRVINSMADGLLKGMGYGGGIVSMLKNTGIDLVKQNSRGYKGDLEDSAWKLLDVSPPVSSKVGKIRNGFKEIDRAGGFAKATQAPMALDNPLLKSGVNVMEAVTNIPTARILTKIETLVAVADEQRQWYERLALLAGWKTWEIEPEVVYNSKTQAAKRKLKSKKTKEAKRRSQGSARIKAFDSMSDSQKQLLAKLGKNARKKYLDNLAKRLEE